MTVVKSKIMHVNQLVAPALIIWKIIALEHKLFLRNLLHVNQLRVINLLVTTKLPKKSNLQIKNRVFIGLNYFLFPLCIKVVKNMADNVLLISHWLLQSCLNNWISGNSTRDTINQFFSLLLQKTNARKE